MRPTHATSREDPLTCRVAGQGTDDVTVRLAGSLTRDAPSQRVERAVEDHCVDDGVRTIHLDLRDVDAIDLEGIGVLVHLFRESRRCGKVLTVEGSEGAVRRRLMTTGVLRIMEPPRAGAA